MDLKALTESSPVCSYYIFAHNEANRMADEAGDSKATYKKSQTQAHTHSRVTPVSLAHDPLQPLTSDLRLQNRVEAWDEGGGGLGRQKCSTQS